MHIRLLVVGDRQPSWVDLAFDDYAGRLPRQWRFRLQCLAGRRRGKGGNPLQAVEAEGQQLLKLISPAEFVVLLDERGQQAGSQALAGRLADWLAAGKDLTFVIGGPDGVSNACRQRADYCWSLSKLTLPHGLARVLVAEQLYRAWSISEGHPYHRE